MMVLSQELKAIAEDLQSGPPISTVEQRKMGNLVTLLSRLAFSMERELEVHRMGEDGKAGRRVNEQLATEQLGALLGDPDGKVVRPDFGGRS